jgi:serine/threonine protein kinase
VKESGSGVSTEVDPSRDVGAGEDTQVDPLREAAPTDDVEARRAKASIARGLFGGDEAGDPVMVGRYRIDTRRGAGGMGVVYEAWDPELERRIAVKLLHPEVSADHQARGRMLREARALARLSDPNVIQVYDVGTTRDQVFVAMEFVEGQTMGDWLGEGKRPWAHVLDRFVAAGRGLQAAHDVGLVHRDFKPDNVLIGDDGRVRVLDFGLARAAPELDAAATGQAPIPLTDTGLEEVSPSLKAALTQTGALVGTPLYMAPEQFEGRPADALSDQYSFCVSLYQGLYGQRPFEANSIAALVRNVVSGRVLPPPVDTDVPAALEQVLRRGMALEREDRFDSMRALNDALQRARDDTPAEPAASRRGVAIGFAALLLLGSAAAFAWSGGEDPVAGRASPNTNVAGLAPMQSAPPNPASLPPEPRDRPPARSNAPSSHDPDTADAEAPSSTASADAGETGEHPTSAPPHAKRSRDFCFIHEDTYALLRRSAKRHGVVKATDGQCYECRPEKRQNRIERFGYKCGGYYVCNPTDVSRCK